jgi:hypothetical protein
VHTHTVLVCICNSFFSIIFSPGLHFGFCFKEPFILALATTARKSRDILSRCITGDGGMIAKKKQCGVRSQPRANFAFHWPVVSPYGRVQLRRHVVTRPLGGTPSFHQVVLLSARKPGPTRIPPGSDRSTLGPHLEKLKSPRRIENEGPMTCSTTKCTITCLSPGSLMTRPLRARGSNIRQAEERSGKPRTTVDEGDSFRERPIITISSHHVSNDTDRRH